VTPKVFLTIGNFDGVHLGHQKLLRRLVELKKSTPEDIRLVALSFEPHPIEVLRPGIEVERLTPPAMKEARIKEIGIDEVVLKTFDLNLAAMSPQEFFKKVVVDSLNAKHLVVGTNFKFGNSQSGDTATLQELGDSMAVQVEVLENEIINSEPVSSSRIRKALVLGDVTTAAALLGRPHRLFGTVVHGEKRGSTIGVPTANLRITSSCKKSAIPKTGVYVSRSHIGDAPRGLMSVTNVGFRPTVSDADSALSIETHVLKEVGDLYGKTMSVEFLYRIRDEIRFSNLEQLKQQIQKDIAFSKSYLPDS